METSNRGRDMKRKTVLLVDDVKLFLRLEETFFQRAGCKVFTAESGREAIKVAKEVQPDLILLDYYMPDRRGDDVCRELRSVNETRNIPIIIVSTSSKKEDIDCCFEAGCNDYLTKPIQPEAVLARSAQILEIPFRLHRRMPVNFRLEGEAPPLTFTGFSRNLSRGGIMVEMDQTLEIGQSLKLWLPILESNKLAEVKGEVVRFEDDKIHRKTIYGVKFIGMAPELEQALDEYLAKHLNQPRSDQ
jgi:CheY-like chemotaxis protein